MSLKKYLDGSKIKDLSQARFDGLLALKSKLEREIIEKTPIVITTCKASGIVKMSYFRFHRVIVDEAAQSQEIETLLALKHARQAVLIGDPK